ncbi:MAG: hypothetical protein JNK87_12650 [Bryobacterales bacterium]|nr:hypothetical protein [Bryobacterales bacterium]
MPLLVWAYAGGPDARHTGAPGDQTCATAGCHTGTAVNGGPGNVAIAFPNESMTYTPGTRQRWTVTVTDAQQRVFGFQATARLESNLSGGQAGSFQNVDARTAVICDDGAVRPASGCRAAFNVEFIQHTNANTTNTFTIDWDPPATDVGNVRIYIAGNAANGNNTNSGDRIYTRSYTLTPATTGGGGNRPTISAVGEGFNFTSGVAPGSWTTIFGSNLSTTTRDWNGAGGVSGTTLPASLDGVSVTINNRPATMFFISPGQINVLSPNDVGTGPVNVVVTNAAGASQAFATTAVAAKPAFYAPFAQEGRFFVTAVALDGTYVGKRGADPRVTRGARPGEVLQVFATGFGATNPVVSTTQIFSGAPAVVAPVRIRFGETVATVAGNGNLVAPGLYQFNVTVPATLQNGDVQLFAEVGGVTSSNAVYVTIERP